MPYKHSKPLAIKVLHVLLHVSKSSTMCSLSHASSYDHVNTDTKILLVQKHVGVSISINYNNKLDIFHRKE